MMLIRSIKSNFHFIILMLVLTFFVTSCVVDEQDSGLFDDDAWISVLSSIDDESDYRYFLGMDQDDNNIAISDQRILVINKEGQLTSDSDFKLPEVNSSSIRIHNGKIYRFFSTNSFENFDPNGIINLEIYDTSGGLLSSHTLEADGLMYDVEIENSEMVGVMVYNKDNYTTKVQKFHIQNGLQAQYVVKKGGTGSINLYIAENGDYHCFSIGPYFVFDNDLNRKVRRSFTDKVIFDIQEVPGHGKLVHGSTKGASSQDILAFLNESGEEQNRMILDTSPEKWISSIQVNDDVICISASEPESGLNMELMFFDFEFNLISTVAINGRAIQSNIILNDNESFSFIYGAEPDEPTTDFDTRPRVFKFDKTYTIPTIVIEQ